MAKAVPTILVDELRALEQDYLRTKYSHSKFNFSIERSSLKKIFEYFKKEVSQYVPRWGNAITVFAGMPIIKAKDDLHPLAKKGLDETCKVVEQYAPEWLR
jgi:hypothetical protein